MIKSTLSIRFMVLVNRHHDGNGGGVKVRRKVIRSVPIVLYTQQEANLEEGSRNAKRNLTL